MPNTEEFATDTYTHSSLPVESDSLGGEEDSIMINNSVIASIVKMAAREVNGVYSVGGTMSDSIWETLSSKKGEKGVSVAEDDEGNYRIEIHLEMRFGVELAKAAKQVQHNVRTQIQRMTEKGVSYCGVIIDGVCMDRPEEEDWETPTPNPNR